MATRRKTRKPRSRTATARRTKPVDDDLAMADEMLRQASKDQPVIEAEWKKFIEFLKKQGVPIPDRPIGAKKLRERMIREGLDPEGTEFSRGIIEMREE
jgi:hypothetical protein